MSGEKCEECDAPATARFTEGEDRIAVLCQEHAEEFEAEMAAQVARVARMKAASRLAIMRAALSALVTSYDEREQDAQRLERALTNARLVLKAASGKTPTQEGRS